MLFVLKFPTTQRLITSFAEKTLSQKLKTKVSIGAVEVGLFNRVVLKEVTVEDQSGKEMLHSRLATCKVALAPLLKGHVSLRSVSMLDGSVRLYKARRDAPLNFQFLLDAFKSDDTESPSKLHLQINSLILRRCSVSYDEYGQRKTPGRFNPKHIRVGGLNANVSLKQLTPDSLNLRIRSFGLKEQSGLEIRQLSLRLAANRRKARITDFEFEMPGTRLRKEDLLAEYDASDFRTLFSTLSLSGSIRDSYFSTADFACFVPQLGTIRQKVLFSGALGVTGKEVRLRGLRMRGEDNAFRLRTDVSLKRTDGRLAGVVANVEELAVPNELLKRMLPPGHSPQVAALANGVGNLGYVGSFEYAVPKAMKLKGTIRTQAGTVQADVAYAGEEIKGKAASRDLSLSQLLGNSSLPAKVDFDLSLHSFLQGKLPDVADCRLNVRELQHGRTELKGVSLAGSWRNRRLVAHLASGDPEMDLDVDCHGFFDGKNVSDFQATAQVRRFVPAALHLTQRFGEAAFSAGLFASIRSLDKRHPDGSIEIKDFRMEAPDDSYHLQGLSLSVVPLGTGSRLRLESDFASASIDGELSVKALERYAQGVVSRCLPGLWEVPSGWQQGHDGGWRFSARLLKTDFLQKLFGIPLEMHAPLDLEGNLHPQGDHTTVSAHCGGLDYDGTEVHELRFFLQGKTGGLSGLAQAKKNMSGSDVQLSVETKLEDGTILADLLWDDGGEHKYKGGLSTVTTYGRPDALSGNVFTTEMRPTSVTINDTVWNIASGKFHFGNDGVDINDFSLSHDRQSLFVNGRFSKATDDSLTVDLKKIDLAYVLGLINFRTVSFSGLVSGNISLARHKKEPELLARLDVEHFCFNDADLGQADVTGRWNAQEGKIELDAMMRGEADSQTHVAGYVSPVNKDLDLLIDSRNTDVRFLNQYVAGIFGDVEGRTTGTLRLFGPFKQLDFSGHEKVEMTASVLSTGVRYHLSEGDLSVTPGCFEFSNIAVADKYGNKGVVNGQLLHAHLKNLRYKLDAQTNKMLVYDKGKTSDLPFYATVYGTGNISIEGYPGNLSADINLTPDAKTQFVYALDAPDDLGNVEFLTFRDKATLDEIGREGKDSLSDNRVSAPPVAGTQTDIKLNFLVNMNPQASLKVLMDERSGDNIVVQGTGPLRANWYNKGSFNMFGTFNVERGTYKMSIQDIIRKDFELTKGGRITFSGNPYNGELDLKAVYTVNSASLSDLNIGNGFSEGSTRADCILNFKGRVHSPEVSFGLDLPNVNEDEKQMVRNLLSTEEDLNMQILYLLSVGRFYTYDYGNLEQSSTQSQSSVAMKSFLSNTISSQLNNIISNAIGSSNWSFGTNLSTGHVGWSDMEVEGLLSGRLLNNRLLINGNFGYRDRPEMSTNFVGDFDVNYLLVPSGDVSLKAYSETNDRYFSKSSLTTQGIGILLKRSFFDLKDLFTTRKNRRKAALQRNNSEK